MTRYPLHHRHQPDQCGVTFTSFKRHNSPLRHQPTPASYHTGRHAIWRTAPAGSETHALRPLPHHPAEHTTITPVSETQIP